MKKTLFLFAFMLFCIGNIGAQASKLVGTWALSDEIDVIIDIKKDGTLSVQEGHRTDVGTWTYNADTKDLEFSSPQQPNNMVFEVKSVSASKLELRDKDRDRVLSFYKSKGTKPADAGNLTNVEKKIIGKWGMIGLPLRIEFKKNNIADFSEGHEIRASKWTYDASKQLVTITPEGETSSIEFIVKSVSKQQLVMAEQYRDDFVLTFQRIEVNTAKPANPATLRKNIIGDWTAYASTRRGIAPEEQRENFKINFKSDGSLELLEHGQTENTKWKIDENGILILGEEGGRIEPIPIVMPNKNILIFSIEGGGDDMMLLRNGSPEPKDISKWMNTGKTMKEPEAPAEKPSSHANYNKMVGSWQIVQIGMDDTQSENLMLVFDKNGKMTSSTEAEPNRTGKWKMDEEGTFIQIAEDYGYDYYGSNINILEITEDTVRLLDSDGVEMLLKRKK